MIDTFLADCPAGVASRSVQCLLSFIIPIPGNNGVRQSPYISDGERHSGRHWLLLREPATKEPTRLRTGI